MTNSIPFFCNLKPMFRRRIGVSGKRLAFWLMLAGFGVSGVIFTSSATATSAPCETQVSYARGFKIETVTNPGNCTWTAPTGITQVDFQLVGGGGGGAFAGAASGGGGGGQYIRVNSAPVVPGDTYPVSVGIGGSGGLGSSVQADAGASGGRSTFMGCLLYTSPSPRDS